MQNFINNIYDFFNSILEAIKTYFTNNSFIETFFDKQVLDGSLLSIGMTWQELLSVVLPLITLFFFIILIFKIFINMIGLFTK